MTNAEKIASMSAYLPVVNVKTGKEYAYIYDYSLAFLGSNEELVQAQVVCKNENRLETVDINDLALAPGIDIKKARGKKIDRRNFDYSVHPKAALTDAQILEAMRKRTPVIADGRKYLYIDRFIISYDDRGKIIKQLKALDFSASAFNTIPAYKVNLLNEQTEASRVFSKADTNDPDIKTETPYGKCYCGCALEPVWFVEDELMPDGTETGRSRTNVSHLICPACGKKFPVDGESLAKAWH